MPLNTASAVVSFYAKLEDQAANFYEQLASVKSYSAGKETFQDLAKENHRHRELVERTYREVITDALEACFAFSMNESHYTIDTDTVKKMSYLDAIRRAIEIEEKDHRFCLDASEKSKSLMSDLPQAFRRIAGKKLTRVTRLRSLLESCLGEPT